MYVKRMITFSLQCSNNECHEDGNHLWKNMMHSGVELVQPTNESGPDVNNLCRLKKDHVEFYLYSGTLATCTSIGY